MHVLSGKPNSRHDTEEGEEDRKLHVIFQAVKVLEISLMFW